MDVTVADNLRNWSDSVNRVTRIAFIPLSLNFSDSTLDTARGKSKKSPTSLKDKLDGIAIQVFGLAHEIQLDDSFDLDDDIDLADERGSSDSFNLSDFPRIILVGLVDVSDSMSLSDGIVVNGSNPNLVITVGDTLELFDFFGLDSNRLSVGDAFSLSSRLDLLLNKFSGNIDGLMMSDSPQLALSASTELGDSFSLSDFVELNLSGGTYLSFGDSLLFTDTIESITGLSNELNYLRRYLNDVWPQE